MIGHELGGRYQIIERIGGGGMALVYKAHDILLGRNVAIKVLRQQFVHDEEFIRRFRREAQSAASLSHANVVSIYDVGQEDEIHYIVMEYIEGHNLNEIIKERAPLQVDEAVRIASQICDALDHAHQNQIIHRDIKPHNILIGRNGRVKVTDFGIARAVTSTTITQTGSVVGSVHYFSPEHAKGVVTGEKSDLYSLGIVLYQMLTANLPFLGESPISVALKHLQEEFEEPREVNPLIPQSVENVILKSMRKNPQERYQSAKEMLTDLETCLLPERRNEPKMTFDDEDDVEQTRVIPAIKAVQRGSSGPARNSHDRSAHANAALFEDGDDETVENAKPKKGWKKPALIITITVLFLALFAGLAITLNNKLVTPDVVVPNVIKMQEDEARRALMDAGLDVDDDVVRLFKEGFEEGQVYDQSKLEGAVVKEGTVIQLFVSTAKPLQKMPDLTGKTYDEAYQILSTMGITLIKKNEEHSDEQEGKIFSQSPESSSEIDPETTEVTLTVSKGKDSVAMPDLVNLTQQEAKKKLEEVGLKLGKVQEEPSFTIEAGKVTKQWPYDKQTSVAVGSEVELFISTGYPPEAINYTFNLPVAPVEEGKNSKVRITYSDARTDGETKDWGTETFKNTKVFSVNLVLAPNKEAVVSVYRNGEFMEAYPISYSDAKNGTVKAVELPAQEPIEPENTDEIPVPADPQQEPDENEDDANNEEAPVTP